MFAARNIFQTTSAGGGGGGPLYSMTFPHTFSSTALGKTGPTLYTQVNRPTTNTTYFSLSGGIQLWTPPETRNYTIFMRGASGGQHSGTFGSAGAYPGAGASATFTIALDNTKTYAIVIGQRPENVSGSYNGSAGGGGTFMYEDGYLGSTDTTKIVGIVGGGGGTGHGYTGYLTAGVGRGGSATTNSNELTANAYVFVDAVSTNYASAQSCGNKGIGQGGQETNLVTTYRGSGGGTGWLSNGDDYISSGVYAGGGTRFTGGDSLDGSVMDGGFGGGGGSNGTGNAGGGGGGYTGGGAGAGWQSMSGATGGTITRNAWGGGAGGGSFINTSATSVTQTAGVNGTNSYINGTMTIT